MLPKRKIIRKQYIRPEGTNESQNTAPSQLIDKLKSIDTNFKQEALAYVSSICSFVQGAGQLSILAQLIAILYQGCTNLVNQCLFALANICQISEWVTPRLFQLGLDKALLQLNSNDKNLLKPIMVLMIAINKNIPNQYRYLINGVQSSLTPQHLLSQSLELVLSFLICTEAKIINKELTSKIFQQFNSHEKIKTRSLCLSVLLNNQELKSNPEFIKSFLGYCEEIINDLNLQKQYTTNLVQNKPTITKNTQTEQMQEEQQVTQQFVHPNYQLFIDAVEGTELLLEQILKILEGQEWSDEEIEEEGDQLLEEKPNNSVNGSILKEEALKFLIFNYAHLANNASLTFVEGQNIVSLALRLIVSTIPQLSLEAKQNASIVAIKAIQTATSTPPSEEILLQIHISALFLLLQCGLPEEGRRTLINIGIKVLKVKQQFKECWLFLLELYSTYFNPDKRAVSPQENVCIGQILKNLLINIPYLQLQEWRAQVIDTIFDIFSNEQFDNIFIELGFIQILQVILSRSSSGKKKKFIKEVLLDITRFLDYKKKMIKI